MKNNRLIIISYRLPFSFKTENRTTSVKPSAGGLVTAVKSLDLSGSSQKPVWIGCADFTQRAWEKNRPLVDNDDFEYVPVFLDRKTNQDFYNGFANSVLWPLFHYFPSYVDYRDEYLRAYQAANQAVCAVVSEVVQPSDIVWVHDYHFLALPQLIRERHPNATIGFFLHIPFPSYELLRLLPVKCRTYLLTGLLGADLVGFHTTDYTIHFLQSVQLALGMQHKMWKVSYQERLVQSNAYPIGINYALFNEAYGDNEVIKERVELKSAYKDQKIIFSVDRLDYTKGVMQRLDALDAFLQEYPEWRGRIVFILVVVPSRDEIQRYWERKQMIEQAVGRINGKYGTLTWLPIMYQYAYLAFPQLIALYTACDVALITPIRDGMNLVAKEFIATRKDQQGVLVLSEMTGAANELGEALLIDPLDEFEVAEQLKLALEMAPEEQTRRMAIMQQRLSSYDVEKWANSFMNDLLQTQEILKKSHPQLLKAARKKTMLTRFAEAQSRLLLLDYDGTLANFAARPELAAPSEEVTAVLSSLAAIPGNKVVVISGRDHETLESWLGHLPIDMVAEHGSYLKQEGGWRNDLLDDGSWKEVVRPFLNDFVSRCPASFVEEKNYSLAWHYRNSDPDTGFLRSRELINTLEHLLPYQLRVLDGNKVVEIKNVDTDKGKVAKQLTLAHPYELVLAIGDDRTDEDMFCALNLTNHFTIKVGKGSTNAKHRLESVSQVISLLRELAEQFKSTPAL
ncbi:bifunctional alpha,alpha-trehalose-phosphate synthase (UDP-forming)/trehalose-phosphatase [Nibrella saemangeumensis]|uniref:Bifunctional alpha,alpha-trehalose-phosphate synthase (UDP-forming)/trehalose-phosphatase n=1 Tax=Nibrella saemangeumensis TaxID=1084526 RepID=A0ABP8NJ91_9BACT